MNTQGIPQTDREAEHLRAYVPVETLLAINKISAEECAAHDLRLRQYESDSAAFKAAKEREKKARLEAKQLKAKTDAYFRETLFPRSDAARNEAWIAASRARAEAIAAGETPRLETIEQMSARVKAAKAQAVCAA